MIDFLLARIAEDEAVAERQRWVAADKIKPVEMKP